MLQEHIGQREEGYKCNRCSGIFSARGEQTIQCPFCSMLCDEAMCRVIVNDAQEY